MATHPTEISLSILEVASKVASLRYDKMADFFKALAIRLDEESLADEKRGYHILSKRLDNLAASMQQSEQLTREIWDLCKDKMGLPDVNKG